MTVESAQPRKASNVTRPFPVLWVGSWDETNGPEVCARWRVMACAGE